LSRGELAKLLLDSGADPNILAGIGYTALDLAEQTHAVDIAKLIELHGGKRGAEL
jgi:ankyrin repeat protein